MKEHPLAVCSMPPSLPRSPACSPAQSGAEFSFQNAMSAERSSKARAPQGRAKKQAVCVPQARFPRMSARSPHQLHAPATPEVALLLRAHSEQQWLSREVVPVVRQIATREELPEEQLPAAQAYLEVIWSEAGQRAGDTDKALTCLDLTLPAHESPDCVALAARARRYRAAVVVMRETLLGQVAPLLATPIYPAVPPASNSSSL